MKIAFSAAGKSLADALDPRFGRTPHFLVYDTDLEACEVLDNTQNLQAAQGAGIQSAQAVAQSGAECLVTGHCGPKAFRVLQTAGVRVYTSTLSTVAEALEAFRAGTLPELSTPDVEDHWT